MNVMRSLGLIALAALVTLALSAQDSEAKGKKRHHGKGGGHHAHKAHHDHDCDFTPPGLAKKGHYPPGLAKQGKVPPGWSKKCQHDDHVYDSHDHRNKDYGYHHDRDHIPSPCHGVIAGSNDKAVIIAGTTAAGATMGGVIGSATGDTTSGAILGGVVGGILGVEAAKDKDNSRGGRHSGDC